MSETTTKIIGRRDYGWGVEMTEVVIEGQAFYTRGGKIYEPCGMCDDNGTSGSKSHFAHVLAAVCFQCGGKGVSKSYDSIEDVRRVMKRREAARARAERKRAEQAAAQRAERDAWAEANFDLAARLAEISDLCFTDRSGITDAQIEAGWAAAKSYGNFIVDLAHRSVMTPLTENQTAAVAKALTEHDARQAADAERKAAQRHLDAQVGEKVVVTGTVTVAMTVDGYAYGSHDRMLVIEGTGEFAGITFKTTGSGATLWETEKGQAVEIAATVKKFAEYNGTPQTVLTRSKIKALASA